MGPRYAIENKYTQYWLESLVKNSMNFDGPYEVALNELTTLENANDDFIRTVELMKQRLHEESSSSEISD